MLMICKICEKVYESVGKTKGNKFIFIFLQ